MIEVYGLKPVKFHWYPSVVMDPVFKMDYSESIEIKKFCNRLIDEFNKVGIKNPSGGDVRHDNKIVFECLVNGRTVMYGFKDWQFSVGFGVMTLTY